MNELSLSTAKLNSSHEMEVVFHDIAIGLAELHVRGLVHRDVKPENMLVTRDRLGNISASVGDLGQLTQSGAKEELIYGTLGYVPPETFRGTELEGSRDVYAYGMSIVTLLIKYIPQFSQFQDIPTYSTHLEEPEWFIGTYKEVCFEKKFTELKKLVVDTRANRIFYLDKLEKDQYLYDYCAHLISFVMRKLNQASCVASPKAEFCKLSELAEECIAARPSDRPTMNAIVERLR
jgi:serine/threonine protein kinase